MKYINLGAFGFCIRVVFNQKYPKVMAVYHINEITKKYMTAYLRYELDGEDYQWQPYDRCYFDAEEGAAADFDRR